MSRDQKYFSLVAEESDKLMARTLAENPNGRKIAGNDPSLPEVIQDLHPAYVLINTNGVLIMVGQGRAGYGITWYSSDPHESGVWHLETNAEGDRRVAFSKRK